MSQRTRKLLGLIAILVTLVFYPLVVMHLYSTLLMGLPWWASIIVFCIAGLAWFFPASWIIRWMSRPDPTA